MLSTMKWSDYIQSKNKDVTDVKEINTKDNLFKRNENSIESYMCKYKDEDAYLDIINDNGKLSYIILNQDSNKLFYEDIN